MAYGFLVWDLNISGIEMGFTWTQRRIRPIISWDQFAGLLRDYVSTVRLVHGNNLD